MGITPKERALEIIDLICSFGYEVTAPHPLMGDGGLFMQALRGDKKQKTGKPRFVVPSARGALIIQDDLIENRFLRPLINGEYVL
jgi:3-dehydroquinate synthetase